MDVVSLSQERRNIVMNGLNPRDRELVALGAAMGSNCVPCVEYHIPESRKAGLADAEIHAAIQHADKIRQVPARKTLQAALKLLPSVAGTATGEGSGCGATAAAAEPGAGKAVQPNDQMKSMISAMLASCGSHGQPAAVDAAHRGAEAESGTGATAGCC